jgi:hypothetical protein
MIQLGSAAAALASILGLAFTLGDKVTGAFAGGSKPHVGIHAVSLQTMSLRNYLDTKVGHTPGAPYGYSKKDLDSRVLVADLAVQWSHDYPGDRFPANLTLQRRQTDGSIVTADAYSETFGLDRGDDSCGCHAWFKIPKRPGPYRVNLQVMHPNDPVADPLDERASDWVRL